MKTFRASVFALAALVAGWLVTPTFVGILRAALPAMDDFSTAPELDQLGDPPWTDCGGILWGTAEDTTYSLVAPGCVFWNADSFGTNQYSEGVVTTSAGPGVGVRLTGTDAGNDLTGYSCELGEFASWIYEWSNESTATALTTDTDIEESDFMTPYTLRVEITGSAIRCLVDDVEIMTASDGTYTTGSAGILSTTAAGGRITSWEGGDLSAPPASTQRKFGLTGAGR